MSFTIVKRTISGVDDQRALVDNTQSPLVRTMIIGDNWTKLRGAFTIAARRTTGWTSPPRLYWGLTAGTSAPPGTGTPNHFLGWRTNRDWDTITNGLRLFFNGNNDAQRGTIVNGSETFVQAAVGSQGSVSLATYGKSVIAFEITKGSPDWTIECWYPNGGTLANITTAQFQDLLNMGTLPSSSTSPYYIYKATQNTTIAAPDEGTHGAFDSLFVGFLGSTDGFEISDIDYSRLAV